MSTALRVGFIGLGAMGWPMAARLVAVGAALKVADATPLRAASFARDVGGLAAASPSEAAAEVDYLITMLPNSAVVEAVLLGHDGALTTLNPGAIVIEMSSGAPGHTIRLSEQVDDKGSRLVDAPVSGGVERARTGSLAIMVGGVVTAVERATPILAHMGSSITHTGQIGSAHAMKALNNLASAAGLLISVETLLLGKKFGLDTALMVDVLNASTGMNNSTQKKLKQFVLSRQFNAGFGLDLMVKDLGIALDIGRETATPTPFAALCREIWAAAAASLGPGRDHTEIARLAEMLAGTEL